MRRLLGNPLSQGVIWSGIGSAIFQILTVVGSVLTAKLLGPDLFGEYGVVQTTVATITSFIGSAISLTAAKFVAERSEGGSSGVSHVASNLLGLSALIGALGTIGVVLAAPAISHRAFNSATLAGPLRLGAIAMLCSLVASTQAGVLVGLGQFRRQAYVNVARGLVFVIATLLLTRRFGLTGAIISFVLVNVCWVVGNQIEISQFCRISFSEMLVRPWELWRRLGSFSLPALLQATVSPVAIWLTTSVLGRRPGGLHELGIFNAANLWRYAILFVPLATSQPLLTFLARARAAGDVALYRRRFLGGVVLGMAAVIAAVIVVLLGNELIVGSYGAKFDEARKVLPVVVLGSALAAYAIIASPLIYTLDHMWAGVVFNMIWCAALIVCCELFVTRGALGFAWAYVVSGGIQCLLGVGASVVYLRQLARERPGAEHPSVAGPAIVTDVAAL